MIRFWTELGISDEMTKRLAEKAMQAGFIGPHHQVSVNGGDWQPCSRIRDVRWEASGAGDEVQVVSYSESSYREAMRLPVPGSKRWSHLGRHYPLAWYEFKAHETNGHEVSLRIETFVGGAHVEVLAVDDRPIIQTSILQLVHEALGKLLHGYGGAHITDLTIPDDNRSMNFDVSRLKTRAVEGQGNRCLLNATVRTDQGTEILSECPIHASIIDRMCATVPVKRIDDRFSLPDVLSRNDAVVFFDADHADRFVSADVAALAEHAEEGVEPDDHDPVESGRGIVYILTNESMPGCVKIGRTSESVSERVGSLNTTGVPTPFEVFYAAFVDDPVWVESALHDQFADERINARREFFRVELREVHQALAQYATGDATFS